MRKAVQMESQPVQTQKDLSTIASSAYFRYLVKTLIVCPYSGFESFLICLSLSIIFLSRVHIIIPDFCCSFFVYMDLQNISALIIGATLIKQIFLNCYTCFCFSKPMSTYLYFCYILGYLLYVYTLLCSHLFRCIQMLTLN